MFVDLGWLLGILFQVAPLPCACWAAITLLQRLLVPAQLWLTKTLVDALARQAQGGAARDTFLWLCLLAASLLLERALGGVTPGLQAAARETTGASLQQRVMQQAFVRDAGLLVLDEPTAALDLLAELALFQRFTELVEGRTAIMVSHRLGMARLADAHT